jgi:hypothetical protein
VETNGVRGPLWLEVAPFWESPSVIWVRLNPYS